MLLTLPCVFIDYTQGIFVRRDDKLCWKQQQWNVQSFFFRGFIFCFKLTQSPCVCFLDIFLHPTYIDILTEREKQNTQHNRQKYKFIGKYVV